MALVIPHDLENLTPADASQLQQNYAAVESYVNTEVVTRDGQVAMLNPLLLPGNPTQNNHASNKAYVDTVVAAANALITSLTSRVATLEAEMNAVEATNAAQQIEIDRTQARSTYTEQSVGPWVAWGGLADVTTNANGDFTYDFTPPAGVGAVYTVASVSSPGAAVGAWIVVTHTGNTGFTGRLLTAAGGVTTGVPNTLVGIVFNAVGVRTEGWPPT